MTMRQSHAAMRFWLCCDLVVCRVLAASMRAADEATTSSRDQVYVERDSGPLKADVYVPHGDGPFPGVLVVHGGAWAMGTGRNWRASRKVLAKHGYTAVAISYRLAPQDKFPRRSTTAKPRCAGCARTPAKYKIDPERIGGFGYSAGGHLVALLGHDWMTTTSAKTGVPDDAPSARLQVVVAGGAPCDFRAVAGRQRAAGVLARRHAGREAGRLPRRRRRRSSSRPTIRRCSSSTARPTSSCRSAARSGWSSELEGGGRAGRVVRDRRARATWRAVSIATAMRAGGGVRGAASEGEATDGDGEPGDARRGSDAAMANDAGSRRRLAPLGREEYVEQAHLFRSLGERLARERAGAGSARHRSARKFSPRPSCRWRSTSCSAELRHAGVLGPAMARLTHYFTPFQAFVIQEAENERRRFDLRVGLEILRREAEYRAEAPTRQGLFLYQFEVLSRNRLGYDRGLEAVARDPAFDETWRDWILTVRRQIGMVDLADLIYVHSEYYHQRWKAAASEPGRPRPRAKRCAERVPSEAGDVGAEDGPARDARELATQCVVLFGEREGRIALANRRKDPLYLFASLHRQLGYPEVPRPQIVETPNRCSCRNWPAGWSNWKRAEAGRGRAAGRHRPHEVLPAARWAAPGRVELHPRSRKKGPIFCGNPKTRGKIARNRGSTRRSHVVNLRKARVE